MFKTARQVWESEFLNNTTATVLNIIGNIIVVQIIITIIHDHSLKKCEAAAPSFYSLSLSFSLLFYSFSFFIFFVLLLFPPSPSFLKKFLCLFVHKVSWSYVHVCPHPCLSTYQWTTFWTRWYKGTRLCV